MAHLLVVDDEQSICWGLARIGEAMGHTVAVAASAEDAFVLAAEKRPDAIVLDVRLPGMDGLAALRRFRADLGPVPVVIITAYGELNTAVEAVRGGALDYLVKPFDLQVAERAIRRALELPRVSTDAPPSAVDPGEEMVGTSRVMQEVFKRVALAASCEACIHLRGESGTGKELIARAIHRYSRRAAGPFVPVHLAALAPTLAESELFGHVRGAFTGADQPHRGLLEQAHNGTVFLDEVAEIPPPLQVKLLRVLESGEFQPVGGDRPICVDFRVISATHQDLRSRVAEGKFRHDLFFRLVTFEIEVPPLRQRKEDIRAMAERFLDLLANKGGGPRPSLSPEGLEELQRRPWYGNVRELRNCVEHGMILARGGTIAPEHFPPPMSPAVPTGDAPERRIASLIRQWTEQQLAAGCPQGELHQRFLRLVEPPMLEEVMRHCRGQCAAAARHLGLHRTTLRKRLDELGIVNE